MTSLLARRDVLQLLGLGAAGAGVGPYLQGKGPIGRDVSRNGTAAGILQDRSRQRAELERPI